MNICFSYVSIPDITIYYDLWLLKQYLLNQKKDTAVFLNTELNMAFLSLSK